MPIDYYEVLGISKSATSDEIKSAYRKAAHKHHPDKGGESEKFKEINEAYQVLGDERKRAAYDRFGHAGVGGASGQGGFEGFSGQNFGGFEDIFGNFGGRETGGFKFSFGGGLGDIFGDIFENAFSHVQAQVEVPLSTALLGGAIKVTTNQGETIEFKIPEGTKDGTTFSLRGKGGQTKRGRGDLHLTVKVRFPRRLSREQKQLIEELRLTGF